MVLDAVTRTNTCAVEEYSENSSRIHDSPSHLSSNTDSFVVNAEQSGLDTFGKPTKLFGDDYTEHDKWRINGPFLQ
jgi:hypothetical protein